MKYVYLGGNTYTEEGSSSSSAGWELTKDRLGQFDVSTTENAEYLQTNLAYEDLLGISIEYAGGKLDKCLVYTRSKTDSLGFTLLAQGGSYKIRKSKDIPQSSTPPAQVLPIYDSTDHIILGGDRGNTPKLLINSQSSKPTDILPNNLRGQYRISEYMYYIKYPYSDEYFFRIYNESHTDYLDLSREVSVSHTHTCDKGQTYIVTNKGIIHQQTLTAVESYEYPYRFSSFILDNPEFLVPQIDHSTEEYNTTPDNSVIHDIKVGSTVVWSRYIQRWLDKNYGSDISQVVKRELAKLGSTEVLEKSVPESEMNLVRSHSFSPPLVTADEEVLEEVPSIDIVSPAQADNQEYLKGLSTGVYSISPNGGILVVYSSNSVSYYKKISYRGSEVVVEIRSLYGDNMTEWEVGHPIESINDKTPDSRGNIELTEFDVLPETAAINLKDFKRIVVLSRESDYESLSIEEKLRSDTVYLIEEENQ